MPPRILLADDSVTVQKVVELTFADEGIEVVAVGDGRHAIERIDAAPPDIVLADVSMPECDGYEVCAHVKHTPALAHIPVVLMTGTVEQLDEARARDAKYDGVLAKPFEPQLVIAMVRDLLAGRGAPASARRPVPTVIEPMPGAALGFPFGLGTAAEKPPRTLDEFFDRIDEELEKAPVEALPAEPQFEGAGEAEAEAMPEAPRQVGDAAVGHERPSSLADAFSDLLADELGEGRLASSWAGGAPAPARPLAPLPVSAMRAAGQGNDAAQVPAVTATPATVVAPVITDELVGELARRVAERMSDEAVRAEVTRHVIDVAERLVREEIERLKG